LDEAIAELREAVRLQRDNADAHHMLGICLFSRGKTLEAITAFRETIRLKPTIPNAHNQLAWALAFPSTSPPVNYEEALIHARTAVELAPDDVLTVNTLALAEYRSGHWAESVAAAERAMRMRDAESADDWFILALARWQKREQGPVATILRSSRIVSIGVCRMPIFTKRDPARSVVRWRRLARMRLTTVGELA
jgi:tetratricopeptide (TPR) repeat protein